MDKIKMTTPLVEMDGDEMTRVLWAWIKEKLILPFVDLKTEYYDLGLLHRNETRDQVTIDAANATKRLGVAVKCATITPNRQRMEEYPQLTEMWKSPNGTIRAILDGTAFRAPIVLPMIHPVVKNWEAPITIARHAYGDMYKAVDMVTEEPGTATLTFKGESGAEKTLTVQTVSGPAVWQGQHNTEKSIRAFARSCFQYAINQRQDLWFSTKDTISKVYDGEFKRIFEEEYETTYKAEFEKLGLTYFYTLIDDAVARVIRSRGGFIWALKNYDGDVMSDMVATAFGSLAMMTSVLVSPDGTMEFEASHGTVTRHYYKYLKGEKTSTNPLATIFAWSGGLKRRGELDGLPELVQFGQALEDASLETLKDGVMTKDLLGLVEPGFQARGVDSEEFLDEIAKRLADKLGEKGTAKSPDVCSASGLFLLFCKIIGCAAVSELIGENRADGIVVAGHQQRHIGLIRGNDGPILQPEAKRFHAFRDIQHPLDTERKVIPPPVEQDVLGVCPHGIPPDVRMDTLPAGSFHFVDSKLPLKRAVSQNFHRTIYGNCRLPGRHPFRTIYGGRHFQRDLLKEHPGPVQNCKEDKARHQQSTGAAQHLTPLSPGPLLCLPGQKGQGLPDRRLRLRHCPPLPPQQIQHAQPQSIRQGLQQGDVREPGSPLPFGDRPVRHMQGRGQLLLGHVLFFPGRCD